jgi:hypothetical protein
MNTFNEELNEKIEEAQLYNTIEYNNMLIEKNDKAFYMFVNQEKYDILKVVFNNYELNKKRNEINDKGIKLHKENDVLRECLEKIKKNKLNIKC